MTLTLEQRDHLLSFLPDYPTKATGRPRADVRQIFEAIVWVLESGARWQDLDKYRFGVSYRVPLGCCHRYFQEWVASGVWERAWQSVAQEMEEEEHLRLVESFIDGSFVPAKKGGTASVTPTKAKAVRVPTCG